MLDELNPYAAPTHVEPAETASHLSILRPLRAPSLGLLLLSGSMCLGIPMGMVALVMQTAILVRRAQLGLDPFASLPGWEDAGAFAGGIACITASIVIFRGALAMRRGNCYRSALIAAILSSIPVLSPLYFIGIPFGIWALIVLRRPQVRAAFDS